jgi:voltage-gated potassium channel
MLIQRVWQILDVAPENDRVSQAESIFMFCLILLNAASIILETVQSIKERYMLWFETLETISVVLFTLEYLGRLWSCVVVPEYASPLVGRLRRASSV